MSNPTSNGTSGRNGRPQGGQGPNRSGNIIEVPHTVSGVPVDITTLRYKISTKKMEEFIQTMLDACILEFNERFRAGTLRDDDTHELCEPCHITVESAFESDRCVPLMVTLPRTIEVGGGQKKQKNNYQNNRRGTIDILQTSAFREDGGGSGKSAQIHSVIFQFFKRWMYTQRELNDPKFKHENNLTTHSAQELSNTSRFTKCKFRDGRPGYCYWISIDPFYVVHPMLRWKYDDGTLDNRAYRANIREIDKNRDQKSTGQFIYTVERTLSKGNRGKKNKGGGISDLRKNVGAHMTN